MVNSRFPGVYGGCKKLFFILKFLLLADVHNSGQAKICIPSQCSHSTKKLRFSLLQGQAKSALFLGDIVLWGITAPFGSEDIVVQEFFNNLMQNTSLDPGGVLAYVISWWQYAFLPLSGTRVCSTRMTMRATSPLCNDINDTTSIDNCCKLEKDVQANFRGVLKLLKYFVQAPGMGLVEEGEANDLKEITDRLEAHGWPNSTTPPLNREPAVVLCKFGSRVPLTSDCQLLQRTYSTQGLSYVFNAMPFLQVFNPNQRNLDFYEEVVKVQESVQDHSYDKLNKVVMRYFK